MNKDVAELLALSAANKIASKLEHVTEEQYAQLVEKLTNIYPSSTADRLNLFRLELGDEHYGLLVNSPNFKEIFEKWELELTKKAIAACKQGIRDFIPGEEIAEKDLDALLWVTINEKWMSEI